MVKRVTKVRKSAILEHLLDLERQIRSELSRANIERRSAGRSEVSSDSRVRDDSMAGKSDGAIVPEIAQRYLH